MEKTPKDREDSLLDLLIMAYVFGVNDVSASLHGDFTPNIDKMNESVNKETAGESWKERLKKAETIGEIERIFVTESHRCFSDGQWDTAKGNATHKTWITRGDEKVRDSHWYIDGLKVGIDDYFYALDGDRALKPYGFTFADNNINCRCTLKYTKE